MPEQEKTVGLLDLSERHEKLSQEYQQDLSAIRDETKRQREFVDKVDALLALLQQCAPKVRTTAAANTVNRIAWEWQRIFTKELRIPKNIYEVLEAVRVPDICEPTLYDSDSPPLGREVIAERIRERAYLISKDWKVSWLRRQFLVFSTQPERIHELILQVPKRSPDDDWCDACAGFACDVLNARIDLALQLGVDSFEFLEDVWLEDVKRLKAYLHWSSTHPDQELDDPYAHYDTACQEIHKRLLDPMIKAGKESFVPIGKWLRDVVLDNGYINTATRPYAHALVEKKARHLWEHTQCGTANEHWNVAVQYVRDFYEHLIPAVVEQDRSAIKTIITGLLQTLKRYCENR